jgi:SAM-dependent methyltransferase
VTDAVVWHDVECGAYTADLALWRELAAAAGGPVLELGSGTGRVALDLAEQGHEVTALDSDPELLGELAARAEQRGLGIECLVADAREIGDPRASAPKGVRRFALVLAPMQLLQILGGPAERGAVLRGVAAMLVSGGRFATAISAVDDSIAPHDAGLPLPDVGERDGWVYSSQPIDVRPEPGGVAVERLRQRVSPRGELDEQRHTQRLDSLGVDELEREAAAHALTAVERHAIPATADHIGSMVVVCRR